MKNELQPIAQIEAFQQTILKWFQENKREMPWRRNPLPYYIWVSEIMLQQTRVDTVIPYFQRFIEKYPDVEALSKAKEEELLKLWEGLGYYNRARNLKIAAEEINKTFIEIIAAPSFSVKALDILKSKKNIRIMKVEDISNKQPKTAIDLKKVGGGLLVQTIDFALFSEDGVKNVTKRKPSDQEMKDLIFAWKIVKHTKSNGITIAKNGQTIGNGPGQVSRIWACKQAIEHGIEYFGVEFVKGSVLASDAFFPFPDSIEEAARAGITAIIQPGGSIKDEEVIRACDDAGIAMLLTGMRHFKH